MHSRALSARALTRRARSQIMFYAPVLFSSLGSGETTALVQTVITGARARAALSLTLSPTLVPRLTCCERMSFACGARDARARSAAVSAHVLVHGRTRAAHGAWLAWARVRLLTSSGHRAGAVNVLATVVAIVVVDRGGRKILFTQGGIQMAAAEIAMAGLIAWNFRPGAGELSQSVRSGAPRGPELAPACVCAHCLSVP